MPACFLYARQPVRLFLATLGLIALASPLHARDVKVSGMGIRKCAEWQQWKTDNNGEARAMTLEWAQGFITGHNVYARSGNDAASSVVANTSVLSPLLDSYCQKNPDQRILSGVIEITQNLGGARVNLAPKTTPQNPRPDSSKERES